MIIVHTLPGIRSHSSGILKKFPLADNQQQNSFPSVGADRHIHSSFARGGDNRIVL
jgi:hypothetical protein